MKYSGIETHNRSAIDPQANIATNFKWHEVMCKCGKCDLQLVSQTLMEKLEQMRDLSQGAPITITSGYRCPDHNQSVGGAPASKHMEGHAADIKVKGITPTEVARIADQIGFTGIKIYPSWVHVDLRSGLVWKPNLPWLY